MGAASLESLSPSSPEGTHPRLRVSRTARLRLCQRWGCVARTAPAGNSPARAVTLARGSRPAQCGPLASGCVGDFRPRRHNPQCTLSARQQGARTFTTNVHSQRVVHPVSFCVLAAALVRRTARAFEVDSLGFLGPKLPNF